MKAVRKILYHGKLAPYADATIPPKKDAHIAIRPMRKSDHFEESAILR